MDDSEVLFRLMEYHSSRVHHRTNLIFRVFVSFVTMYLVLFSGVAGFIASKVQIANPLLIIWGLYAFFALNDILFIVFINQIENSNKFDWMHYTLIHDAIFFSVWGCRNLMYEPGITDDPIIQHKKHQESGDFTYLEEHKNKYNVTWSVTWPSWFLVLITCYLSMASIFIFLRT